MEGGELMLHEIARGSRLFYPRRLINSLVRWVLGVHSPEGTIKIQNTASPDEKSLALDVDMSAILSSIQTHNVGMTSAQRQDAKDIMRAHLDGTSLIWTDEVATINKDWLSRQIAAENAQVESDSDEVETTSYTDLPSGQSTSQSASSYNTKDGTTGAPDKTTQQGLTMYVLSRVSDKGVEGIMFFRKLTISCDGRITGIGAEEQAHTFCNDV